MSKVFTGSSPNSLKEAMRPRAHEAAITLLPGDVLARLGAVESAARRSSDERATARNDGDMPSSAGPDAGPDAGESDDIPGAHS
ncbi:MAG TPA: hypothetical protein VLH56_00180 [Dissulfurispiraceae bacterium]|nr:hypothetical protein [Dissulfurispiraceae bacterium]